MPDWDDIFTKRGKVFTNPHQDMERLTKTFNENGAQRVLDLGCGTGRHLLFFSKKGFDVYGLDGSPKGLELAKNWLDEENLSAKLAHQRIDQKFPYENDFFDVVISIQVIHHNLIKEILFSVKEIERVLKPKGFIFITVPFLQVFPVKKWKLKKVEKRTYIPQSGPEKGLPHHFFTIAELKRVLSAFELLEIYIDKTNHRAILGKKK
jgi:SAM-dependent methyltransferase